MSRRGQRIRDWMGGVDRSVTPVIATILIVALVIVIAASFGAVAFGFTDKLGETTVAAGEDRCVADSIGFNPEDIESFSDVSTADLNCVMWFDASQEPGGTLETWSDQSGSGFDLTTVDPGNTPERTTVDDIEVVEFTGNEGYNTTSVTASDAGLSGNPSFTVMTVVQITEPSYDGSIAQFGKASFPDSNYYRFGYNDDTYDDKWFVGTGREFSDFQDHDPTIIDFNNWYLVTHIHDSSQNEIEVYVNGIQRSLGESKTGYDITDDPIYIGYELNTSGNRDKFLKGNVAELVVFDRALDVGDREIAECILSEKHGSAVNVEGC